MGDKIKKDIRDAIEIGKLSMRPRWHFLLRTVLMLIGIVLVLSVVFYIVSFVIFSLHENGVLFIPIFGSRAWLEFFISLPWILILLSFLFIGVLELLVRKFSFGYRQPLLYTAIGIILIASGGGVLLAKTSFQKTLFSASERNQLPPFARKIYRGFRPGPLHKVHIGTIEKMTKDGFFLKNRRGDALRIVVNPETRFPLGTEIEEGDNVVIFGPREKDMVQAIGIRKAPDDSDISPLPRPPRRPHFRVPWAR